MGCATSATTLSADIIENQSPRLQSPRDNHPSSSSRSPADVSVELEIDVNVGMDMRAHHMHNDHMIGVTNDASGSASQISGKQQSDPLANCAQEKRRTVWLAYGGQRQDTLPYDPAQWLPYTAEVTYLLTQVYDTMVQEQGKDAHGKMLDLSKFTDPVLEYTVCKGQPVLVVNPNAEAHLVGQLAIAGYPADIWSKITGDMLPKEFQMCAVIGCFFQVHNDCLRDLELLDAFLADSTGRARRPTSHLRRRIVIQLEFPKALADPDRFRRKRGTAPKAAAEPPPPVENVTVGDERIPAVYEWWFGPAPPQERCSSQPEGRWKMYHPQVCRSLEETFRANSSVQSGRQSMDVDGIRYMITRISQEIPYDAFGQPSLEPVLREDKITVDHPCFSTMDRESGNCFVQFRKGNPHRRRPARRRPDAADVARLGVMTGNPCSICFSDDGFLTGCMQSHLVCKSCLRNGLRSMAGDTMTIEHLLCGCFTGKHRRPLLALAERADIDLQALISTPPTDRYELQDFQNELEATCRQFDIGARARIPPNVYVEKIQAWFTKVHIKDTAHLYYVCSNPACAEKVQNWILKDDFEKDYQAYGLTSWTCPAGHKNSVLPSEEDIRDYNKNILLHPEYYTESYGLKMRRYRLCAECIPGGVLVLCAHDGGCKHWPGSNTGHRHIFCFSCMKVWGRECDHSKNCTDPGIQQVRSLGDRLECGYVDGPAYISWLQGRGRCPPTVFPSGRMDGDERQAALGMTDKKALLATSTAGTR